MLGHHSLTNLSLTFDKNELLKSLRANREKHQTEYAEAVVEYGKQLVDTLERKLSAAKAGKKVSHQINLRVPVEYIKEYDRAINMLANCTDTTIVLDPILYAQLVQDDWQWKDDFLSNTATYSKKMVNIFGEHGV